MPDKTLVSRLLFIAIAVSYVGLAHAATTVVDQRGEVLRVVDDNGNVIPFLPPAPDPPLTFTGEGPVATPEGVRITIDSMTMSDFSRTYTPASSFSLLARASVYTLSDGSTWNSGAGSYSTGFAYLDHVEVESDTIRYIFHPAVDGLLYRQTDFDSGNHSSQGTLGSEAPLVLEATRGERDAVMRGGAEIISNDMTSYGEPRFNFFSAVVGAVVPFEMTYSLSSGGWQPDTFESSFSYSRSGWVEFSEPISVPLLESLEIIGSGQVPAESSIQYVAAATYDNGSTYNITGDAVWSIAPAELATVDAGLVVTGTPPNPPEPLVLMATYSENGNEVQDIKHLELHLGGEVEEPGRWPTFQGNRAHTGHVPMPLEPDQFNVRWIREIDPGRRLHQVAAADGLVFVSAASRFADQTSLWALDARDGETVWSKAFGGVSSVNPPGYGYGNVYIQTGKATGSSPPPYLHAFDAETGELVFQARFGAQWESYLAPTVYDGHVYANVGTYGGMSAFDAFSGETAWFANLPQYDDWTPAVDEQHAYAYLGEYAPALYVHDRITGEFLFRIDDPNFDWSGWSMNLAPALGDQGDVIVIHDGRLISFDVAGRLIRWEHQSNYRGQPAVHDGVIYAIDGGRLVAVDEASGLADWLWGPGDGSQLSGEVLITDTHVFVGSDQGTWAIELLSREDVWWHPATGTRSMGNDTLYIAGEGVLTAIGMPEVVPATVVSLTVEGPAAVFEGTTVEYRAVATYDDGRVRDRTGVATWGFEPAEDAAIDADGRLTVGELFSPVVAGSVSASYEEEGVVVSDEMAVELRIGTSVKEFLRRNINGAIASKQEAMAWLEEARVREEAARRVLEEQHWAYPGAPSERAISRALQAVLLGMHWGWRSERELGRSLDSLAAALAELNNESRRRTERDRPRRHRSELDRQQ